MNRLWDTSHELSGCNPTAVGRGYRQGLCSEGCNRFLERVLSVPQCLLDGLAVRDAVREVRIGDEKPAPFVWRQGADLEGELVGLYKSVKNN